MLDWRFGYCESIMQRAELTIPLMITTTGSIMVSKQL
jgi:hypothetical protein